MSCPKGEIKRVGYTYTRKNSKKKIKVASTCITDRGKTGKGPKLIKMKREDAGMLGNYGYALNMNHEERVKALKRALRNEDNLVVLRHLNAIRTLQKSNETLYKKLDKDVEWLKKYYQARTK